MYARNVIVLKLVRPRTFLPESVHSMFERDPDTGRPRLLTTLPNEDGDGGADDEVEDGGGDGHGGMMSRQSSTKSFGSRVGPNRRRPNAGPFLQLSVAIRKVK
jgi:hypothetical protein